MSSIQTAAWIEGLLKKANVEITDEIKTLLAADKNFSTIPADLAGKIEGGLLTIAEATQHPEVRRKALGERLGGMDSQFWQMARDEFKLSRDEYSKVRGEYNSDTGKHEGSIADTWPKLISFFNELSEKKGEGRGNVDTSAIRAELAEKLKGEWAGKFSANQKTISEYELKNQTLTESLEKKDREMVQEKRTIHRDFWLEQEIKKYLPRLKPELVDVSQELVDKARNSILKDYIVKKDEKDQYQPFLKADPSARALDANTKIIDLQEHIGAFWSKYINPNPDTKSGTKTVTKTVTKTGGNGIPSRMKSNWS